MGSIATTLLDWNELNQKRINDILSLSVCAWVCTCITCMYSMPMLRWCFPVYRFSRAHTIELSRLCAPACPLALLLCLWSFFYRFICILPMHFNALQSITLNRDGQTWTHTVSVCKVNTTSSISLDLIGLDTMRCAWKNRKTQKWNRKRPLPIWPS